MKPAAPAPWFVLLALAAAAVAVFAFLRPAPAVSTVGGMSSTLTKPRAKKPARRAAVSRPVSTQSRPVKALELDNWETELMASTPTDTGPIKK